MELQIKFVIRLGHFPRLIKLCTSQTGYWNGHMVWINSPASRTSFVMDVMFSVYPGSGITFRIAVFWGGWGRKGEGRGSLLKAERISVWRGPLDRSCDIQRRWSQLSASSKEGPRKKHKCPELILLYPLKCADASYWPNHPEARGGCSYQCVPQRSASGRTSRINKDESMMGGNTDYWK